MAGNLPSFTRILLVTDFSHCSAVAAPWAGLLAENYGADILVAHVVPETSTGAAATERVLDPGEEMRKFLAANPFGDAPVETILERGAVVEVVADLVRKKGVDLVVVGTHGRSTVGKLLLGSVAQRIFNFAPCPVLTVSPRVRKPSRTGGESARILYATDLSEESVKALPYALSLAKARSSDLVVVHAAAESLSQDVLQGYYGRLNLLIPPDARTWCRYDVAVITGTPATVILDTAALQNADFIVIGAHRAEGTFEVPRTTAYQVVAHAHCPVLRVRI